MKLNIVYAIIVLYSWKIWRGIKFGSLAVCLSNRQIKIHQNFLLAYICMVIPYWTTKFKSVNTFAMAIWDLTAKFNSRQYFRLYGIIIAIINCYLRYYKLHTPYTITSVRPIGVPVERCEGILMRYKWYMALNYAPWVANLADFRPFFVYNFGIEWLLEATVVVRWSIATIKLHVAATWQLFRLAAASVSSMAKWSESSILLCVTGHSVGGAFLLNLILLNFLHTSLWETPIVLFLN